MNILLYSESDSDALSIFGEPSDIASISLSGLSVDDYTDLQCYKWGSQYVFFAKDAPLAVVNGTLVNTSTSNVVGRIYQDNMDTYTGYSLTVYPFTQSGYFTQIYNNGSSLTQTYYYYSGSRLTTSTSYPANSGFEVYYLSSRMSVPDVLVFVLTFFVGVIMCLFLARFFKR